MISQTSVSFETMTIQPEALLPFRKHLEQFVKISEGEFQRALSYFTTKKIRKNQVLVSSTDKVRHTYWVVKGLLLSTYNGSDGKEHVIQVANENCWITDQNAFYNQADALFTISSFEDSELLCLPFEKREQLCLDMPVMEHFFRKKANDSFVKQQKRLLTYMTSDSQKRYELLLAEYPQLIQRLPKKILAAYLGVSRETLSRFSK